MAKASMLVPLVADEEALTEELTHLLPRSTRGFCRKLAQDLIASEAVEDGAEFIRSLGERSDVRKIITQAMATAWDEGYWATAGAPDNPYRHEDKS